MLQILSIGTKKNMYLLRGIGLVGIRASAERRPGAARFGGTFCGSSTLPRFILDCPHIAEER